MKLIKKDTTWSLAVFCPSIARVVSQYGSGLNIFDHFLGDVEFPLEFRVFIKPVINDIVCVFNLVFRISYQFHVIFRDSVQWSLEEISERRH